MKRFCYCVFTVLCLAAALFAVRGAANAADGSVYEPGKEAGERRVVAVDGVEYDLYDRESRRRAGTRQLRDAAFGNAHARILDS